MKRYKITVDENSDDFKLDFVSIVEDPAIRIKALAFKNANVKMADFLRPPCHPNCRCYIIEGEWIVTETEEYPCELCLTNKKIYDREYSTVKEGQRFSFSEEKQILAGPALIPNMWILRIDEETGEEYEVMFTEQDIEMIVDKFNKNPRKDIFNLEHTETLVDSAFLKANWIVEDPENDKSKMYGFSLPKGSWFIECKVSDKKQWDYLKLNNQTGFSIEGVFKLIKLSLTNNNKNKIKIKLMESKLKDGTVVTSPDETLAVGSQLFVVDAEGNEISAPTGEHTLEDGTVVVVADGVVTEIKAVVEEEAPVEAEIVKDEEVDMEEVKMVITEDDITFLWEAIKPMVADLCMSMMNGESVEEEMSSIKAELSNLKETIATSPSSKSVKTQLSNYQLKEHSAFEERMERFKSMKK